MQTYDVILAIQSRLQDYDSKKWNENEILDTINQSYMQLARILRLFLQTTHYKVDKDSLIQDLPSNFLDIAYVKKDKRNIPIVRRHTQDEQKDIVSINYSQIFFTQTGQYELGFYSYYIVVDKQSEILLPAIAFNALLYHSLFLLLQKKPYQNALQESSYYKNLYEEELRALQRDIYRMHETHYLTTRIIVV